MIVQRKIGDLTENTTLKANENYSFDIENIGQFKEHFEYLKRYGFVIANSFDDSVWYLPCEYRDRDLILRFDIEIYRNLNVALKCYVILKRMSGGAVSCIVATLTGLKKSIMASEGLENLERLEAFFLSKGSHAAYKTSNVLKQFLLFFAHAKSHELIEVCNRIPSPQRNNRDLPNFVDVLTFDQYLTDFFKNQTDDQRIRFYPVYIWWKLTNVIPMRVIEFIQLKKNCLEEKADNTYWIKLIREKKQADSPFKIDITNTLQISAEIFFDIKKYIDIIDGMGIVTPFLFSYDLYVRFLQIPLQSSVQRKGTRNRIIDKYLQRIIDDFYNEVVKIDIDKVTCGDTRHFAIINMFLQGFNMLSIARMAGHDKLDTQINYYSHVDHFVQSQIYMLTQHKFEDALGNKMSNGLIGNRRASYDRGKAYTYDELRHFRNVDFGYCTDMEFPRNCIEDCRICDHYVFKPAQYEIEEGLNWLEKYSDSVERKIQETIEYMLCLSKSMYYDFERLTHQATGQTKLNSASSQLLMMMDHMATVQVRKMEFENGQ